MAMGSFEGGEKTLDRGIEAAAQSFAYRALKSYLAIELKGDFSVAEKELALVPPGIDPDGLITLCRWEVLTLQRKFPEALQVVQQFRGETITTRINASCPKAFFEGVVYFYQRHSTNPHSVFERPRVVR